MRRRLRQVQVSGPGSVNIQVGGDIIRPLPSGDEPWWCTCDDADGPHMHCVWGGKGPHVHPVDITGHKEEGRG